MSDPAIEIQLVKEPSFSNKQTIKYSKVHYANFVRHFLVVESEPQYKDGEPYSTWKRELSAREVNKLLRRTGSLKIPQIQPINWMFISDGITWRLKIQGMGEDIDITWWEKLPQGGESIGHLIRTLQCYAQYRMKPLWWQFWR